ncbi:MAG TPA: DUF2844 domain-containing protein [Steroidobacteraceae bacterium]|nr:DUF2844 domain-containing protein [Steroidobacteraceae bacterium]
MRLNRLCAALALAAWSAGSPTAFAALGDPESSVASDASALHGEAREASRALYNLHALTTGGGVQVNEYATPGGAVFAITWQGPSQPDLRSLLGSYYARYQSAAAASVQARRGAHREFSIRQGDLVLLSVSHLRSYRGVAYVPALMPAGLAAGELQ